MNNTSIQTNNTCLICYGKKIYYNFSINQYRIEECANCSMMRLSPQPSDQDLANIYKIHNENFLALKETEVKKDYLKLLNIYAKKELKGDLLEISYNKNSLLTQANQHDLKISFINLSLINSRETSNYIKNKISELNNCNNQFDYIVLSNALELLRTPREFLQLIHSLLKPEGILITITPSINPTSTDRKSNNWIEFIPERLWYFSNKTLRFLMYSENFYQITTFSIIKTKNTHHKTKSSTSTSNNTILFCKKNIPKIEKKLSIIMAVYNEEKTIKLIIDRLLAKKIPNITIELIIVESNSTDKTKDILKDYENHNQIKFIYQDYALGKGNAIRAGLKEITGDFVLIQDADDEYDFEDYDALIEPLMTGETSFVLGARHGGRAWKMRQFSDQHLIAHFLNFGHWGFTFLVNILFGLRLKDPFTMFKVFRADCLKDLTFECNRFDFDYELLIKLVKNGHIPIEIPVNYRSRSFKEGKKIRIFRDPITWLYAILKLRMEKT